MIEGILLRNSVFTEEGRLPWSFPGECRPVKGSVIALGWKRFQQIAIPAHRADVENEAAFERAKQDAKGNVIGLLKIGRRRAYNVMIE